MNPDENPNLIRISPEEVTSSHVDDMLKRQMSLRGEGGVTRDRGRRWYLQNWFVFMIVGTLAAVAAWAVIEPFVADMLYLQGTVEEFHEEEMTVPITGQKWHPVGWMKIKGEKIWLLRETSLLRSDGRTVRFFMDDATVGKKLGVYVHYFPSMSEDFSIAILTVKDPADQSASRAALTLYQQHNRAKIGHLLFFPLVAGFVGLAIGAVDGFVCRLPRRAIISGLIGLLVGLVGGFVCGMLANLIYAPLNQLAMTQVVNGSLNTYGLIIQMMGRSIAWGMAGMAMGLGQGIALRSKRLLIYGLLGGIVGGLLGGLLFDPINMLGSQKPTAFVSRLVALAVVGCSVGALIGVVELLARDAWLRMTQGPLAGKEFLVFKDVMNIGSSPRADMYLFNDPLVLENHAILRVVGDECEIESRQRDRQVLLNNRPVQQARLRHGDLVTIGRTVFCYQKRKG